MTIAPKPLFASGTCCELCWQPVITPAHEHGPVICAECEPAAQLRGARTRPADPEPVYRPPGTIAVCPRR